MLLPSKSTEKPDWYWARWVPRAMYLVYGLFFLLRTPYHYIFVERLAPKFWEYQELVIAICGFIIFAFSWLPIVAGILALLIAFLTMAILYLSTAMSNGPRQADPVFLMQIFLITSGILSVIWQFVSRRNTK
jgi:hypothetical protein